MKTKFHLLKKYKIKIYSKLKYLNEVIKIGGDDTFIVSGKRSFSALKDNFNELEKISEKAKIFSSFQPNPNWRDVQKGLTHYNKKKFKFIIAIGGGSVIDIAKLLIHYGDHYFKPIFVVIPTTAGSGSEATNFAVLYKNGIKYSVVDEQMNPDFIVHDSNYLTTNSLNQLSISGLDALCQSLESLWSKNSDSESSKYANSAFLKTFEGLKSINQEKIDYENLQEGAYLSGKAINISKTTAPHAISYYLTSNHQIPHGYAVSLTLPYFIIFNLKKKLIKEKFVNVFEKMFVKDEIQAGIFLWNFFQDLPIDKKLKDFQLKEVIFDDLYENLNKERLKNNPERINKLTLNEYFKDPQRWIQSNLKDFKKC